MKKIIVIILFILSYELNAQNFPDSTFIYNTESYSVLSDPNEFSMYIYNSGNPQITWAKPLYRTRRYNTVKLKNDIITAIKLVITPQQINVLQQQIGISIAFFLDATGKIYVIENFHLSYQTCFTPSNIYNIEVALKNIVVQFQDGLPPEAGALSVIIPAKMFR